MEYWVSKTDDGQILDSVPCHPHKNRSHSAKPIIPTLQYSIIPLCWITAQPIFSDLAQLPARRPTARREDQVFTVRIKFAPDTGITVEPSNLVLILNLSHLTGLKCAGMIGNI
jgi:hypothetical protein